jgi:NAD(P)-dependent dehydrogenase (short-subunit alcohol dehydrogenase family)
MKYKRKIFTGIFGLCVVCCALIVLSGMAESNNSVEKRAKEAAAMEKQYSNVKAIQADFTDDDSINKLCEQIPEMNIDVLVNDAYVGKPQTTHFHKINNNEFLQSFKDNILPTIRITQKCIEVFRQKKFGKIINVITSYLLNLPPIGFSTYVCNKAYLEELSKVWNKEYTRYNITSNCIAPEFMRTNFSEVDERIVEQMESSHPLKKLLEPKEVAEVICSLVKASQQVNGVTIPINAAQVVIK